MTRMLIINRVIDKLIVSHLHRNRNSFKKYNTPDIVFQNDLIRD